jgi:hypothetical protein
VNVAVITLNLLQQLNIPDERVQAALTENGNLSQAARLGGEYWPT